MTSTYQVLQRRKMGALSLSGDSIYYFRVARSQPVNTIVIPSTSPMRIPTLIFLIIIPSARPSMIAKMKDISDLLISGFCGAAMFKTLFSCLVQ